MLGVGDVGRSPDGGGGQTQDECDDEPRCQFCWYRSRWLGFGQCSSDRVAPVIDGVALCGTGAQCRRSDEDSVCSECFEAFVFIQEGDVFGDEVAEPLCRGAGPFEVGEESFAVGEPTEYEGVLQQVGLAFEVVVDRAPSQSRSGGDLLVRRLLPIRP